MKIKKRFLIISSISGLILPFLSFSPVLAASASMSLSSAGAVVKGSNITVSIRENSGAEPVNGARAALSYPAAQLQFVSIGSSSAFSIVAASSGGNGAVNVDRGALPATSGSQTIATVTFRALSDTGSAAINITSGQVISANSNTDISSSKTGTSIALRAPVVAPPPPPKDTTPPTVTKISVSTITPGSAVINWTTSEPSTSEISYGLAKSYGLAAVETTAGTVHAVTLNSPLIQPGTVYHYTIKATDTSGNSTASPDDTFTTTGATLAVTVIDQHKKHLSGASVEFDNQTATTDKNGVATVRGVTLGKKTGVITYKGDKYPFSADVSFSDKSNAATAQITLKPNYTVPITLIVVLLLVVDYLVGWKTGRGGLALTSVSRLRSKLPFLKGPNPPAGPPASNGAAGSIVRPTKSS